MRKYSETVKVLGSFIGPDTASDDGLRRALARVEQVRGGIATLEDPGAELVLTRKCADVAKVSYVMRCSGDRLDEDLLKEFDEGLRNAVENTLGGAVKDDSWLQATTAVPTGGLGFREATSIALPAFVASRVAARPAALIMAGHAEAAGLLTTDVFAQHYDLRTSAAVQRWLSDLPVDLHEAVQSTIEDAACAAKVWWDTAASGQESGHPDRGNEEEVPHYQGGPRLINATGAEDAEHPIGHAGALALHLQRRLTDIVDRRVATSLAESLGRANRWSDVRRLREISDPECSHEWLWQHSIVTGPILRDVGYVTAVRLRLGAAGPDEPAVCGYCGTSLLYASALTHCVVPIA